MRDALGKLGGNQCNGSFLRDAANLVLIFVSDENDDDDTPIDDYVDFLGTIKPFERIRVATIVGFAEGRAADCRTDADGGASSMCGSICQTPPPLGSQQACTGTGQSNCPLGEICFRNGEDRECRDALWNLWNNQDCGSCTVFQTPDCCLADAGTRYTDFVRQLETRIAAADPGLTANGCNPDGGQATACLFGSVCEASFGDTLVQIARELVVLNEYMLTPTAEYPPGVQARIVGGRFGDEGLVLTPQEDFVGDRRRRGQRRIAAHRQRRTPADPRGAAPDRLRLRHRAGHRPTRGRLHVDHALTCARCPRPATSRSYGLPDRPIRADGHRQRRGRQGNEEGAGEIATITLNRPELRNAIDATMIRELGEILDSVANDDRLKAIVLCGAGEKAFAAGADIAQLKERDRADALLRINAGLFRRLEEQPIPTVAAVRGYCLGGGCELAMACDLRVAGDSAKFGQPEVSLGIMAGAGAIQRLPKLVGLGRAKELIMTGRIIDAAEAERIGLVNRVVRRRPACSTKRETLARVDRPVRAPWRSGSPSSRSTRAPEPIPGFETVDVLGQAVLFETEDKHAAHAGLPGPKGRERPKQ